jgi:hypothetical protein
MIPMTLPREASLPPHQAQARRRPVIRLWLPLILIWILAAPFLVLLSPLLLLGLAVAGLEPFGALAALLGVLAALGGTRIEVDAPDALVNIHLI